MTRVVRAVMHRVDVRESREEEQRRAEDSGGERRHEPRRLADGTWN